MSFPLNPGAMTHPTPSPTREEVENLAKWLVAASAYYAPNGLSIAQINDAARLLRALLDAKEKAEAELAKVQKTFVFRAGDDIEILHGRLRATEADRDALRTRAEKAEAERDDYLNQWADNLAYRDALRKERDDLLAKVAAAQNLSDAIAEVTKTNVERRKERDAALAQVEGLKAVAKPFAQVDWDFYEGAIPGALTLAHVEALKAAIASVEERCPGHVASDSDSKVCGRCGIHIDELRPEEPNDDFR